MHVPPDIAFPDNVRLSYADVEGHDRAKTLLLRLGVSTKLFKTFESSADGYDLHFDRGGVRLRWSEGKQKGKQKVRQLQIDFLQGANAHRRLYGGGKGQAIAKAVGVQSKFKPSVLDATAGQGGDAFVLASLGCHVDMFERSPVAYALLDGALEQAKCFLEQAAASDNLDANLSLREVINRMTLSFSNLVQIPLKLTSAFDCVYLDPMFPERKKSAAVRKEMRVFHDIIGEDEDADDLLSKALDASRYRVIVKRPKVAPFLDNQTPTYQLKGKSTRFDVYVKKALPV